ncbi:elongation factor Tu [Methanocalculus taiwanensis]|uniref:Elongation factor Tu n=1 Tax=Methanocalculus taiwanensis TaxID=106207 RepID=A0ABD4TLB3_9EURY|nr:EF-Tu/IF-2/RF-3 family GTPase [Methanocalculus taiwanensis]MCQ1538095.1 elongation factor Tu [Methanocalculus taiwanensis]
MGNLTVAAIAPPDILRELGKKGTSSDITFYNIKRETDTITLIEPSRYPERLASLFFSVSMAKAAILVIDEITPQLGECILMLDSAGVSEGFIVLRNYLQKDQVKPLFAGTVLEEYEYCDENWIELKELLLKRAALVESGEPSSGSISHGTMAIDHHFNVKGIGTVVLGGVVNGCLRKHDQLKVLPGERTAQLRSIQKHDDDSGYAVKDDRVGLALKNIDAEDMDRGFVLTTDPAVVVTEEIQADATLVKYWPSHIHEGMVLYSGHWMQFISGKVTAAESAGDFRHPRLTIRLDKPLVYLPGDIVVLHYLEGGKLRIVGSLKLP